MNYPLLAIQIEGVALAVGIFGLFFGIYSYFTSGVLADKKAGIINTVKIENLERRVADLEAEMRELNDWHNRRQQ